MDLNKSQKMVKMVELMQRRGGIRADELRDRFELDARTFRRYLADIRGLGLPLLDEGFLDERTVGLDPSYRRTGVNLTLAEVLSLHFGRKLFNFLEGTQFAADMDDAIERLSPAINRAHAELAADLDRKFLAIPEHAKDYRALGDLLDDLITALIYDNPARAEYTKASGLSGHYELEPLTLATYRQGLYLFARDRADGRVKTFAVERFLRFSRLRMEKFDPPADYQPEALLADAFGIISSSPVEIEAIFDASVAFYIGERVWHRTQSLDILPDGRAHLLMDVGITQELIRWLLSFAGDVEVVGPPKLVETLREHHNRARERLGE
jgi:predicted DNA-binding transcriptional regulator YafY